MGNSVEKKSHFTDGYRNLDELEGFSQAETTELQKYEVTESLRERPSVVVPGGEILCINEEPAHQSSSSETETSRPDAAQSDAEIIKEFNCRLLCYQYLCSCRKSGKDYKTQYNNWAIDLCQIFLRNSLTSNMKHVGLNITTSFFMAHYFFIWLLIMFMIGVIIFGASFYTVHGNVNPAIPVCNENYSNYYMCPLCDGTCDFWYLKKTFLGVCMRQFRLLIDNPLIWGYSALLIISAFIVHHFMICKVNKLKVEAKREHEAEDSSSIVRNVGGPTNKWRRCSSCSGHLLQILAFVILPIVSAGFTFGFFLLSEYLILKFRMTVNKSYSNFPDFLVVAFASSPSIILQVAFNLFSRCLLQYLCGQHVNIVWRFIVLWIYDSFMAYLPILIRIYLHGNIVGDPKDGYKHVGPIRFQHCSTNGCVEVTYYAAGVMFLTFFVSPLLTSLGKCLWSCYSHNKCYSCEIFQNIKSKLPCCNDQAKKCSYANFLVDYYVELSVIYGYVILLITATGWLPLLVALIAIPMSTRKNACVYTNYKDELNKLKKIIHKNASGLTTAWLIVFYIITAFSMFINIAIVVPNSRFIQHIAYSKHIGHSGVPLNFTGYLDKALPEHHLEELIKINALPHYNAHYLTMRYPNGETVRNTVGEAILYLPFINFKCLKSHDLKDIGNGFSRQGYIEFIETNPRSYLVMEYNKNKEAIKPGNCFINVQCRSRGFLSGTEVYKDLQHLRGLFAISLVIALPITLLTVICGICHYCKK